MRFARGIMCYGFFRERTSGLDPLRRLYAPTTWLPPEQRISTMFRRFLNRVQQVLLDFQPRAVPFNASSQELELLRNGKTSGLVICAADKGSTTVAVCRRKYIEMCAQLLADADTYMVVRTIHYIHEVSVRAATREIRPRVHKRVWQRLSSPGLRVPNFYGLPKLHKKPVVIRPIVFP